MTARPDIVVVGEGMLELSGTGQAMRLGYGGDTLNTAIHLARFGLPVAFFTAIGSDRFSEQLRSDWAAQGVDTGLVLTDPDRHPGLYAIHTDPQGERSFTYWRDQSAARRMFELGETSLAIEGARQAGLLFYSLISLAILPSDGREQLLGLAGDVRERGGRVAFDGNYRPSLWGCAAEVARLRDAAIASCDIGLPTLDDERQLFGLKTAAEVAEQWRSGGASEVIVKAGSEGAFVNGVWIAPSEPLDPVDTTGAGDAFNAGFLAARLEGANPRDAALVGNRLAAWVVMRPGAVPPPDADAPYDAPALTGYP